MCLSCAGSGANGEESGDFILPISKKLLNVVQDGKYLAFSFCVVLGPNS